MNTKSMKIGTMLIVTGVLLVGLIMLNGCKKEEPTPTETTMEHAGHEHASMAEESVEAVTAAIEQTTCPVMGSSINKAIFVEYEGKKVYFCCPPCKDKFNADPEKYIAKLPQFNQEVQ
jgi:YHS domain-containing protein